MANTFDASLVNKVLSQTALTKLKAKVAYLKAFTTDFSQDIVGARSRNITVPVYTSGAALINPTDFYQTDVTGTPVVIAMDLISRPFSITPTDFQTGSRLENLAEGAINAVAKAIEAKVFALVTEANFGTPGVTGITDVSVANIKKLWGMTPGDTKSLILSSAQFSNILPNDLNSFDVLNNTGYGYDYLGYTSGGFSSASTKIVGVSLNKSAIAVASAIPEWGAASELLDSTVIEIEGLGLSIQSNVYASGQTRAIYGSFDVLFGASVGTAEGTLLKTV